MVWSIEHIHGFDMAHKMKIARCIHYVFEIALYAKEVEGGREEKNTIARVFFAVVALPHLLPILLHRELF